MRWIMLLTMWWAIGGMAKGVILTERYNPSFLDLSNGLPHNNVSALFTDSKGFL